MPASSLRVHKADFRLTKLVLTGPKLGHKGPKPSQNSGGLKSGIRRFRDLRSFKPGFMCFQPGLEYLEPFLGALGPQTRIQGPRARPQGLKAGLQGLKPSLKSLKPKISGGL